MFSRNHKKLDGQNVIVTAYNKGENWFVATNTYDQLWNEIGYEFVAVRGKQNAIDEAEKRGATLALETREEYESRLKK